MTPELQALVSRLNAAADNGDLDILISRAIPLPPRFAVEAIGPGGADLIGPLTLNEALRLSDKIGGWIMVGGIE